MNLNFGRIVAASKKPLNHRRRILFVGFKSVFLSDFDDSSPDISDVSSTRCQGPEGKFFRTFG